MAFFQAVAPVLTIRNLKSRLVGPVSLDVASGACVAITGRSGSGKSLLLRAIVDLDPASGDVGLGGTAREDIPAWQWRRKVMLVPAESGWWADRVADHFDAECDPAPALRQVGLPAALDWDVARLSTGERHRLAIARAVCLQPDAMLFDEPTAALDAESAECVEALIADQRARGAAILLVTHDAGQVARLADRHLAMDAGRLTPSPTEEAGAGAGEAAGHRPAHP